MLPLLWLLMQSSLYAQHHWLAKPLSVSEDSIVIDGVLSEQSWKAADEVLITNANDTIRVKVLHHPTYLYFAFSGKLESANALFPEILIDADNQRSTSWQSNDWWFHVSATDCESKGAYGVYNNCLAVQSDWRGVPNFVMGAPYTDTVEIAIPWSKLAYTPKAGDSINISVLVTNTANIFRHWPATAIRTNPSSWGTLTFALQTGEVELTQPKAYQILNNPGSSVRIIFDKELPETIELYTLTGIKVQHTFSIENNTLVLDQLPKGMYWVAIQSGHSYTYEKIIIHD